MGGCGSVGEMEKQGLIIIHSKDRGGGRLSSAVVHQFYCQKSDCFEKGEL